MDLYRVHQVFNHEMHSLAKFSVDTGIYDMPYAFVLDLSRILQCLRSYCALLGLTKAQRLMMKYRQHAYHDHVNRHSCNTV